MYDIFRLFSLLLLFILFITSCETISNIPLPKGNSGGSTLIVSNQKENKEYVFRGYKTDIVWVFSTLQEGPWVVVTNGGSTATRYIFEFDNGLGYKIESIKPWIKLEIYKIENENNHIPYESIWESNSSLMNKIASLPFGKWNLVIWVDGKGPLSVKLTKKTDQKAVVRTKGPK